MEYNTKWIKENLGITGDMIDHYEKKENKIISIARDPISNNRIYTDDDIEKLWTIKFLIKIGFKTSTIKSWQENASVFDFERVINEKYESFKQEVNNDKKILSLLKYIKTSGRIPTVNKLGEITFDEFSKIVFESITEDDIDFDEQLEAFEKISQKNINNITNKDLDKIYNMFEEKISPMICDTIIKTNFKTIIKLKELKVDSKIINEIFKTLYFELEEYRDVIGFGDKFNVEVFKKYFNPTFYEGDIRKNYELEYGRENIEFISKLFENLIIDGRN